MTDSYSVTQFLTSSWIRSAFNTVLGNPAKYGRTAIELIGYKTTNSTQLPERAFLFTPTLLNRKSMISQNQNQYQIEENILISSAHHFVMVEENSAS